MTAIITADDLAKLEARYQDLSSCSDKEIERVRFDQFCDALKELRELGNECSSNVS